MDEGKRTKKNIWNDDDGAQKPKKANKSRRGLWSFLAFLLILAVILAAYRDGTGFDVLRRYLHYGKAETSGGEAVYDYDSDATNHFAVLGQQLVVLSETGLQVLSPNGEAVWSKAVNMNAPALDKGNAFAVAYDIGGTALYVVDEHGEVMTLKTEETILAATLNDQDWLAVTTEKQKYKGCVQVYDPEMELVFAFNSSRRFVTDATVIGEGKGLAAVTLGQENSTFVSNIVLYDLSETEPKATYDIADGLVMAIDAGEEEIVTVSDNCLTHADTSGKVISTYGYGDSHLRGYTLEGDGFSVLHLNRYVSGSMGKLVSVGPDGAELGSLDVKEEILDISAAGRYLAILYADRVVVCNPDLQVYSSLTGMEQARGVQMRADGSVLLLSAESAHLYLP